MIPTKEAPDVRARTVAIIADGNRRWAQARGLPVGAGHEAGADTLKARLRDATELGIEQLTIYSFSTENWGRPAREVDELITMLAERVDQETLELHREGVRMRFIGRRTRSGHALASAIARAEQLTANNTGLALFIALDYGARDEILHAAERYRGGGEAAFLRHLYAPEMCDPDLIIRTGGDHRLSNFLLWQAAYSELLFRKELWPDFSRQALIESLAKFSERRRGQLGR